MLQKFDYKFSQLIGTVYKKGNLIFTQDGQRLFSCVGNRISIFDLKSNKTETLPVENRYNFATIAISPNGCLLVAVNEVGEMSLISLKSKTVLHRHHYKGPVSLVKFSPNGKYIALAKGSKVFLFSAPLVDQRKYNPYDMKRVFHPFYEDVLCLDWSSDSRVLIAGGADKMTRVLAVDKFLNHRIYSLGGHHDYVIGCFFEENSLDAYTISRNGELLVWESNLSLDELEEDKGIAPPPAKKRKKDEENESDVDEDVVEENVSIQEKNAEEVRKEKDTDNRLTYKRVAKFFPKDEAKSGEMVVWCTAVDYHKQSHLLATGFSNGVFVMHQMPDYTNIFTYSVQDQSISTIAFNPRGNWVAAACEAQGALLVWDWASHERVMDQQGCYTDIKSLDYSPLGDILVTGGQDGKAKLWDTKSSFRFATLTHSNSQKTPITSVVFSKRGNAVFAAYTNGCILAFDIHKYKCFRTFEALREGSLSCLTLNHSGELLCAVMDETYEIMTWKVAHKEPPAVLSGHTGNIHGLAFDVSSSILVSTGQDTTCRVWGLEDKWSHKDTIELGAEGLCVAFRPDGLQFAVSSLKGHIQFFEVDTANCVGFLEGLKDLEGARKDGDLITAKKSRKTLSFTTMDYTTDGECLLAAGKSKFVCIYHIASRTLLRKFEITCNHSLDGITDYVNIRKMTEFGSKALIEERDDGNPGIIRPSWTKVEDLSKRTFKPEVVVFCIKFSPSERSWAAATTEGVVVYSLDNVLTFNPGNWDMSITPRSVRETLAQGKTAIALSMALRLNEHPLIREVVENIPLNNVELVCQNLPIYHAESLLRFLAQEIDTSYHFFFYQTWIHHLSFYHEALIHDSKLAALHRRITMEYKAKLAPVIQMRQYAKYTSEYLSQMPPPRQKDEDIEMKESAADEDIVSSDSEDDY